MNVFRNWDGKTVSTLEPVARQLSNVDYDVLLRACRDDDDKVARAASWVLKAAYQTGADIPYPSDLLAQDLHWETALHLLQSVRHVVADISPEMVAPYLSHRKPMVRAWALDAYVHLGAADIADVLVRAADDPAASVRARVRNLTK